MTNNNAQEWDKLDEILGDFIVENTGEEKVIMSIQAVENAKDRIDKLLTLSKQQARQEAIEECKNTLKKELDWISFELARSHGMVPKRWLDAEIKAWVLGRYGKDFLDEKLSLVLKPHSANKAILSTLSALEKLLPSNKN